MSDTPPPSSGIPVRRPVVPNTQTEESFTLPDFSGIELPDLPHDRNARLTVEQVTTKDEKGDLRTTTQIKRSVKKSLSLLQKLGVATIVLVVTTILGTLITIWSAPIIDFFTPPPAPTDKANSAVALDSEATELGDLKMAGWAQPATISDEFVTTIEGDVYDVSVYLLAIEPATADSDYMLSDEVTPVIQKGDPIAYFTVIYTNSSGSTINTSQSALSSSPFFSSYDIGSTFIPQDINMKFEHALGITDSGGMYSIAKPQYKDKVVSWKNGESLALYKNFPIKGVNNMNLYTRIGQLVNDGSGNMDYNADDFETEGGFKWELGEEIHKANLIK